MVGDSLTRGYFFFGFGRRLRKLNMRDVSMAPEEQFMCDVLGLGAVAVDDVLYVEEFPIADAKTSVRRRQRYLGGLAGIALVTAARLGCTTAYAGRLGDDEFSEYVVTNLRQEGINLQHLVRHPDARPIISTVIVGEKRSTRNIFFHLTDISGADATLPAESVIRGAKALLIDHLGIEGMLRATRIARAAGIPVISDLELNVSSHFQELIGLIDHLILSQHMATTITGETRPETAALKLWDSTRHVVVVTCGAEGAWYLTQEGVVRHQPAFSVNAIDTTGCGDVFHGAYAACLVRGLDLAERIRFASAAAALKATQSTGHQSIPFLNDVELFLKEHA